jgi:uncharacterized membrane protein
MTGVIDLILVLALVALGYSVGVLMERNGKSGL